MPYCPECGTALLGREAYCPACGSELSAYGGGRGAPSTGAGDDEPAANGPGVTVAEAGISPPGELAYEQYGRICLSRADGGDKRVLAEGYKPVWSPEGSRLAFADAFHPFDLVVLALDGERSVVARNLAHHDYVLSRDGALIAFRRMSLRYDPWIWTVDTSGAEKPHRLVKGIAPSWGPDGRRLCFTSNDYYIYEEARYRHGVYFVDVADGAEEFVCPGYWPNWSPDGRTIAYNNEGLILLMDADGSNRRELIPGLYPEWSPDGRLLTYFKPADGYANYVYELETGDEVHIGTGYDPSWSPDSRWLTYHRDDRVYLTETATGTEYLLERKAAATPAWRPSR
ncbi:MAG: hypothetical protein GF399_04825 [Candidatus Coatesbacteria bacterium]|nr:hypothetical protein [Candidatus Coatesbacteria bacterium]